MKFSNQRDSLLTLVVRNYLVALNVVADDDVLFLEHRNVRVLAAVRRKLLPCGDWRVGERFEVCLIDQGDSTD